MDLSEKIRILIEGQNYAHIATLMPDGSPHSVPTWIGLEGDHIAFQTDPKSRKARNIEQDPRIAISITDREQPYAMAQIRGRVTERVEDEAARTIIDRLSQKYIGQPYPLRTDRVAFLISPEHARAQTFG